MSSGNLAVETTGRGPEMYEQQLSVGSNAVANSPNDDTCGVTVGRRKEGVAILWNT